MRCLISIILFAKCFILKGQINPLVNSGLDLGKSAFVYKESKDFTALKSSFYNNDSLDFLFNSLHKASKFQISPAFEAHLGGANSKEKFSRLLGAGFYTRIDAKQKLKVGLDYVYFNGTLPNYQERSINNSQVFPSSGRDFGSNNFETHYVNAFVNFKAKKYFDFELGYGRQFIGDGYRSVLRSDFANASPYFKINTQFWKVKYTNLFAIHQDIFNVEESPNDYRKKYSATHFLDWQITKWISLGLFETIIWQHEEGKYKRGVDVNYLNPFIFYRPIEFSTGSSDNVLVGTNIKFTVLKKQIFYFQALLDEFLLSELQADFNQWRNPNQNIRSGWWANKYALQIGWRSIELFQLKGLDTRIEFNMARPFTYAHSSPTQSYSHYNHSLAHPLGANFEELLFIAQYSKEDWYIRLHLNQTKQGLSAIGENFGENLQASNVSRSKEYENKVLQGTSNIVRFIDIGYSKRVFSRTNTFVQLGYRYRKETLGQNEFEDQFFYVKMTSNLFNRYFDY